MAKGDRDDTREVETFEERTQPTQEALVRGEFSRPPSGMYGDKPDLAAVTAFEAPATQSTEIFPGYGTAGNPQGYGGTPGAPQQPPPTPVEPGGLSQQQIDQFIAQREQGNQNLITQIQKYGEQRNKLLNQPTPQVPIPPYRDIPKPPQQQYRNVFKESGPGLIFIAAMGALATRGKAIGAMNAATGYMEGFHTGDKEKMEQARQNWQDNVEAVIKENNVLSERYNAALNNQRISMADKQGQLQAIAASTNDQVMIHALNEGQMDFAIRLPQDRAKAIEKIQEAQIRWAGQGLAMDNEAIDGMVQRRLAGDKTVLQHIGTRAGPFKLEFERRLKQEMDRRGMTSADLLKIDQQQVGDVSYQRSTGTMGARVEAASNEVEQVLPQALEASRNLPRGKWVPINQLIQSFQKGTSKPEYYDFAFANFTLKNAYTRAMNPQGIPRVHDRLEQEWEGLFSKATDQFSYEVALARIWKEVQASKIATAKAREGRTGGDINAPMPGATPGGPGAAPGAAPGTGGWR